MAITNTSKSKEFVAGSSPIILKGDLRLKASAPDPMDERNMVMENIAIQEFGKPLKDLSEDEIIQIEEMIDEMGKKDKGAPSMMMASPDYVVRRMEDLLALGYDYDTAGKIAMDEFAYREAMERGEVDDRQEFGLGSLVKSVKKGIKGVVRGVKDNPLLAAAALNFAPMLAGSKPFFGLGGLEGSVKTFGNPLNLLNLSGKKEGMDAFKDALKVGSVGGAITGLLAGMEQQEGESDIDFANRQAQVKDQLNVQFKRLYPQEGNESDEDYNIRITAMVNAADDSTIPVGEMAEGGRVNRAMGSDDKVEMAAGIEGLPINVNSKGVKEVDLRETGGFIPPVGIKEKADDIPAMLSNNEFVFTADAVRAAGGGSVNKGAQRMYDLMKNLESKVV